MRWKSVGGLAESRRPPCVFGNQGNGDHPRNVKSGLHLAIESVRSYVVFLGFREVQRVLRLILMIDHGPTPLLREQHVISTARPVPPKVSRLRVTHLKGSRLAASAVHALVYVLGHVALAATASCISFMTAVMAGTLRRCGLPQGPF